MTSHAIPFSQHHPNRNRREKRTKPEPKPKPLTIAAVVAYCDSTGWRMPAYAAASFLKYHRWREPDVLQSADRWQAAARTYCLSMPKWQHPSVAPPKRLARAVDIALSAE